MTTFLSLFSGIGGFDLAAYRCGLRFDRHLYSEIDPYAIKVFQARFPDAEPLGDITKIKKEDLPDGDYIIAGGFPCQDISVAGKGAGLAGARSGLWFEMLRIIGDLRPRYVVVENVGALLVRGIDTVLGSLAEIGYDAEWQIISAASVGAPHRRERVYIVAYPEGLRGSEPTRRRQPSSRIISDRETLADANGGRFSIERFSKHGTEQSASRNIVDGCSERGQGKRKALADASNGGNVRRDGKLEPAQGQVREYRGSAENGRGEWWKIEPAVCELVDGLPTGLGRYEGRTCVQAHERVNQLKCLGNAIVPQCAEVIFNLAAFDEWRTA